MKHLWHKVCFRSRDWLSKFCMQPVRNLMLRLQGAKIAAASVEKIYCNWPHQLSIGRHCRIERGVVFKYDGPWKPGPNILIGEKVFIGTGTEFNISEKITVGDQSLIASGCRFVDHDHGIASLDEPIGIQPCESDPITLESNVWIGCNVVVLKGVTIGSGAVVAAGSVVTKSIPGNEIWAGIPAKCINRRS